MLLQRRETQSQIVCIAAVSYQIPHLVFMMSETPIIIIYLNLYIQLLWYIT
ncbi:hypothetical protein Hanom_Chr05g00441361 [Helianthus anomalus]